MRTEDLAESWLNLRDCDLIGLRALAGHPGLIRESAELCGWLQGMLDNLADHKTDLRAMPTDNGPWKALTNARLVKAYYASMAVHRASGLSATMQEHAELIRDEIAVEMCSRLTAADELAQIVENSIDGK